MNAAERTQSAFISRFSFLVHFTHSFLPTFFQEAPSMLALAFALVSAATSVLAHGIVEEMTVGSPAATYSKFNFSFGATAAD